jgi:hypothetical protein
MVGVVVETFAGILFDSRLSWKKLGSVVVVSTWVLVRIPTIDRADSFGQIHHLTFAICISPKRRGRLFGAQSGDFAPH